MKRHIQEDSNRCISNSDGSKSHIFRKKENGLEKKQLWPISILCPVELLEILIKSTKNISLHSRRPH